MSELDDADATALEKVWRGRVIRELRDIADNVLAEGIVAISNFPALQGVVVDPRPTQVTESQVVSAAGDTTLYTPASGKKVRLHWVFMSASQDNNVEVLAKIKLGSTVVYSTYLGNPGAFGHRETVEGAVNEVLKINLSAAESVAVNWTVTEV